MTKYRKPHTVHQMSQAHGCIPALADRRLIEIAQKAGVRRRTARKWRADLVVRPSVKRVLLAAVKSIAAGAP